MLACETVFVRLDEKRNPLMHCLSKLQEVHISLNIITSKEISSQQDDSILRQATSSSYVLRNLLQGKCRFHNMFISIILIAFISPFNMFNTECSCNQIERNNKQQSQKFMLPYTFYKIVVICSWPYAKNKGKQVRSNI